MCPPPGNCEGGRAGAEEGPAAVEVKLDEERCWKIGRLTARCSRLMLSPALVRVAGFFGEFVLGEEGYFAALYTKHVLFEVYTCAMALEHVKT